MDRKEHIEHIKWFCIRSLVSIVSIVMFNVIHDSIEAIQTNVLCPCPGYHLTFKTFLVIYEHHLSQRNVFGRLHFK